MPVLEVEHLRYYYRTRRGPVSAVDDVSFSVNEGETMTLVGESGCGKTSTANAILRLLPRNVDTYEGRILLDGQDTIAYDDEEFRKKVRWRGISVVFQGAMNALNPMARCGRQVAEPLIVHRGVEREEAMDAATESLKSVGLPDHVAERYPHELSGGMKQRVVIAMALVMKPRLVILDEPTSALDVMTQANIINLLKRLQKEAGLGYVFITHDLGLASELADNVAVMYAGRIVEIGPAAEVYKSPQHPYTQKLIQSVPLLRSEVEPVFIPGVPPDLTRAPMGCRFHPRCPYAFNLCGWSSSDLAEFLRQLPLKTPEKKVLVDGIAKMDSKSPWKLVATPTRDTPATRLAEDLRNFVAAEAGANPVLTAVESVAGDDGSVVIKLRQAVSPQLLGPSGHLASCWLLTEEGRHAVAS